jgi:hypothetical protein
MSEFYLGYRWHWCPPATDTVDGAALPPSIKLFRTQVHWTFGANTFEDDFAIAQETASCSLSALRALVLRGGLRAMPALPECVDPRFNWCFLERLDVSSVLRRCRTVAQKLTPLGFRQQTRCSSGRDLRAPVQSQVPTRQPQRD